ncbi:MAG: hypothetical protein V3T72_03515 [Thermoanaerobaculia bacterium]
MTAKTLCMLSVLTFATGVAARPQAGEAGEAAEPPPDLAFGEEITVGLSTIVVRVVDRHGEPVTGLAAVDFQVRVDKAEVPVVAADWVSTDGADGVDLESITSLDDIVAQAPPEAAPRWVVFFVQTDFNGVRRRGHRNVLEHVRRLPRTLPPRDWAAVVFFGSHLELWQDFTRERTPIEEALGRSIRFGGERARRPGEERWPSLARHFDFDAALAATSPERGLELTARALKPFPGQKLLIYVGWGLGSYEGRAGVRMTPEYDPAVEALVDADISVFVLDASYADVHSLEIGLQQIADDTGGMYFRGFRFPESASQRLTRSISGYYLLTLDRDRLPSEAGKLRVDLLRDSSGWQVHVRARYRPPVAGDTPDPSPRPVINGLCNLRDLSSASKTRELEDSGPLSRCGRGLGIG